jgi:hypothetical protein
MPGLYWLITLSLSLAMIKSSKYGVFFQNQFSKSHKFLCKSGLNYLNFYIYLYSRAKHLVLHNALAYIQNGSLAMVAYKPITDPDYS